MLYLKVFLVSVVIGLPVVALFSVLEFGVSAQKLASVSFWLSHPLTILSYGVVSALVVYVFQALGQGASVSSASGSGAQREQGSVKWFNSSKGYGFISRSEGEDVFVHYRSITGKGHRSLYEGQIVEFSVSTGDKGLQADEVQVISGGKPAGKKRDGRGRSN